MEEISQEKKTGDVKGMGQFVDVSCWTEDEELL